MRVETRIYGSGWTVSFILTVMAGQEPVKVEVERSLCGALYHDSTSGYRRKTYYEKTELIYLLDYTQMQPLTLYNQ